MKGWQLAGTAVVLTGIGYVLALFNELLIWFIENYLIAWVAVNVCMEAYLIMIRVREGRTWWSHPFWVVYDCAWCLATIWWPQLFVPLILGGCYAAWIVESIKVALERRRCERLLDARLAEYKRVLNGVLAKQ